MKSKICGIYYVVGCVWMAGLRYYYSQADSDGLRWILAPVAGWVRVLSGHAFAWLPGAGYVNHSLLLRRTVSDHRWGDAAFFLSARYGHREKESPLDCKQSGFGICVHRICQRRPDLPVHRPAAATYGDGTPARLSDSRETSYSHRSLRLLWFFVVFIQADRISDPSRFQEKCSCTGILVFSGRPAAPRCEPPCTSTSRQPDLFGICCSGWRNLPPHPDPVYPPINRGPIINRQARYQPVRLCCSCKTH